MKEAENGERFFGLSETNLNKKYNETRKAQGKKWMANSLLTGTVKEFRKQNWDC